MLMKTLFFLITATVLAISDQIVAQTSDDDENVIDLSNPEEARRFGQQLRQFLIDQANNGPQQAPEPRPLSPNDVTVRVVEEPLEGFDVNSLLSQREQCFDREFFIDASGLTSIQDGLRNLESLNFDNQSIANIFATNPVDNSQYRPGGSVTLRTYDIDGDDIVELLISLEENNRFIENIIRTINNNNTDNTDNTDNGGPQEGPTTSLRGNDGSAALAQTNAFFTFQSAAFLRDGVCRASRYQTAASIDYILPNWVGRATSTNTRLNQQWDDYIETLTLHETGHGIIAYNLAVQLQQIIVSYSEPLDDRNNCPDGFGDRLEDILLEARVFQDVEYDFLTDAAFFQQQCLDNPFWTVDRSALSDGIVRRIIVEPITATEN